MKYYVSKRSRSECTGARQNHIIQYLIVLSVFVCSDSVTVVRNVVYPEAAVEPMNAIEPCSSGVDKYIPNFTVPGVRAGYYRQVQKMLIYLKEKCGRTLLHRNKATRP